MASLVRKGETHNTWYGFPPFRQADRVQQIVHCCVSCFFFLSEAGFRVDTQMFLVSGWVGTSCSCRRCQSHCGQFFFFFLHPHRNNPHNEQPQVNRSNERIYSSKNFAEPLPGFEGRASANRIKMCACVCACVFVRCQSAFGSTLA